MTTIDTASRRLHLRYLAGGRTQDAGTYGTATYGEPTFTYGQEAGESSVEGIDYVVLPQGGWGPSTPSWVFRENDTAKILTAIVTDRAEPSNRLDLSTVSDAELVLRQITYGAKPWQRVFTMTLNTSDNTLSRTWVDGDLIVTGLFTVAIRLVFDTGRYMTVEGENNVTLEVTDAP